MTAAIPPLTISAYPAYRAPAGALYSLLLLCSIALVLLMIVAIHGAVAKHSRKLSWRARGRIDSAAAELARRLASGGVDAEPGGPVVILWAKFRRWLRYQITVGVLTFAAIETFFAIVVLSWTGSVRTEVLVMASIVAGAVVTGALLVPGVLLTQFRNPQLDSLHLISQVLTATEAHLEAPDELTTNTVLSSTTRLGAILPKTAMRSYLGLPNEQLQHAAVARFSQHTDALSEAVLAFDADAMNEANTKTITSLALSVLNELVWTHHGATAVRVEDVRLARKLRRREKRLDRMVNVAPLLAAFALLILILLIQQLAHHHGYNLSHPGSTLATILKWGAALLTSGKLLMLTWNWLIGRSRPAGLEATAHDLTSEASDLAERTGRRTAPERE